MDNQIKFTFWNYLPIGTLDPSIADQWKDMECNLFMSSRFLKGKSRKEDMIALLDKAQSLGIKVIINDERTEYNRLKFLSREEFVEDVRQAKKDFGWHPAVYGFLGGDEPFLDQEDNFIFAFRTMKEEMPELHHYGNLLPYFLDFGDPAMLGKEDSYYMDKMDRLIKEGKLDILAFDQYTQCYDDPARQEKGIAQYLKAMDRFYKAAKKHSIPLYVSLLAIGHYSYREPSEYDIRWQINTALAMGAKGIVWFYFHQHARDYGFFNPPFLGEKALVTPMYGKIQRQQYVFNERFREIFDSIDVDACYHKGKVYEEELRYVPDGKVVDRLDVRDNEKLSLVSFAHYRENPGRKVLIVVNGDQERSNAYSVYFHDGNARHFDLSPGEMRVFEYDLQGGLKQ